MNILVIQQVFVGVKGQTSVKVMGTIALEVRVKFEIVASEGPAPAVHSLLSYFVEKIHVFSVDKG